MPARSLHAGLTDGSLEVQALAPGIIRVLFQPRGVTALHTGAVVGPAPSEFPVQVEETAARLRLITRELQVEVTREPLRVDFLDSAGAPILRDAPEGGIARSEGRLIVSKEMPSDEHYYGFGQKLGFLNKRGRAMEQWATDDPHHTPDKDALYQAIPFFLGLRPGRCYGLFVDCPGRSRFDMGATADRHYTISVEGPALDYYFIWGPSPKQVVEQYTELTGRMELPPLWALGNQQCRWSYYPASRVRELAREFRARQIPCDVLYLDIDYMDGYRVFTWDRERFPDPDGLLRDLAAEGFKVVTIVDPGVKVDPDYRVYAEGVAGGHFIREPDGGPYVGRVWPGESAFPDFARAATRRWWGDQHAALLDRGVAGIWNDMNEPANFTPERTLPGHLPQGEDGRQIPHSQVHNLYGFQMAQATHAGLLRLQPDRRPFLLTRSGYAGIQRYAAVWMGDNHSWWEHLLAAMPMCMGMGLSGVPFVGTDIGGFGGDCNGELLARWTQLGAFMPFCRNHAAMGTRDQEPWAFGPEVEAVCRQYIALRYWLLPFWYQLFREAHRSGLPPMRPLLLEYPDDPETYHLSDQFLLGRDLLVAPVCQPGARHRMVYLPAGEWYDYWTGERHQGPVRLVAAAPLDRMPLYVRAGAVLPLAPAMAWVGQRPRDELILEVYAGPDGGLDLYEDDGESRAYTRGEWSETAIRTRRTAGGLQVQVPTAAGSFRPARSRLTLRIRGAGHPDRALVNGQPAAVSRDGDAAVITVETPAAAGVMVELG